MRREQGLEDPAPSKKDKDKPVLREDLKWVWESYCFLNDTRRSVALPSGDIVYDPITYLEMGNYCHMNCITDTFSKKLMSRLIPPLDKVYLAHHASKLRKQFDERLKKIRKEKDKGKK